MKAAVRELSTKHLMEKAGGEDGAAPTPSEESDTNDEEQSTTTPEPEKFVNTGLQRWEEIRNQWLASASAGGGGSSSTTSSSASSSASTTNSSSVPPPSSPSSSSARQSKKPKRHARDIDIDEVIDLIVSNRWRQTLPKNLTSSSTSSLDTAKNATRRRDEACFPNPVSLPQMVDVLVDLWEAEGLDT